MIQGSAKIIYDSVKQMRFDSENVNDPFSKKMKGNVLESLLSNVDVFMKFIHYAIRNGDDALPSKLYNELEYQGDEITEIQECTKGTQEGIFIRTLRRGLE